MQDYGFDPLGNGQWRLVPSGQIVDKAGLENFKKNRKTLPAQNDCLGLSWNQIEKMQGGKLKRIKQ
jgi:hypothetical protein